jgi:hypothetical protein
MKFGFIIVGAVIAAIGVAVLLGKFSFTQKEEVFKAGPVSVESDKQKTVPQWGGILAVVVGGALVLVGATRKS